LLTGERYRVRDVAPDGRNVRWSPDGEHALFETGTAPDVRTHIVAIGPEAVREVASFPGRGAVVSPDGRRVAYLRVPETPVLAAARRAERAALATRDGPAVRSARAETVRLEAATARLMVLDPATGREREWRAAQLERHGLAFAGDGSLVLIGRDPRHPPGTDLYVVQERAAPRAITDGPGIKGATLVQAGDRRLLYTVDERFVVHDLSTGATLLELTGSAPVVSADGSTVAYLVREEVPAGFRRGDAVVGADRWGPRAITRLMAARLDGPEPVEVLRTSLPLSGPALSPSGRRVAYQKMPRDSWEVFTAATDGRGGEERVTREIQHDQFPAFVTETRLLAMMGEFRHRRAYLYDLDAAGAPATAAEALPGRDQRGRERLFHNNTLRTVAPQYEWSPSPDGDRILVVAHRDGNTLSPETGVFVADLDRPVDRDEVLARVRRNLASERALRDAGARWFAPIAADVRAAVADVDVGRIYDHAHALYRFGSKWYAAPGNALAIDYLAEAFRRMGYEPELQWFEPRPGYRTANVVATLRGTTRPDRVHVISSHFDSVEPSPGADDNTSGTTAMLEAARVLAGRPQAETIRFVLLTAEEAGLLGAREFVRRAEAAGDRVASVLNNDMIGWTRSHRLDNTIRYSNDEIRDLQHAAAILFTDLITYDARYVRGTDAHVFYEAYGDIVGGIGSYPILGNPHYHQPSDILEVIEQRLVAEVSRTTVAAVMALASGLVLARPGRGSTEIFW
jgi:Tol biopolymer transport system component